jgi:Asp-tRNA(Asn)/Glu-tRNA(Gln) amidotransferase A subunit family amidase
VAVAASICDIAVGTDSVGSVRLPAAACGVVGIRVTHDEAAFTDSFRTSPLLDSLGVVARTADDLALAWQQGWFGRRHEAVRDPSGLRVGVVVEVGEESCAVEVRHAWGWFLDILADAGQTLVPLRLGDIWRRRADVFELCARDAWDVTRRWPADIVAAFGEPTRLALEAGSVVSDARRAEVVAVMARCRQQALRTFEESGVDVWLIPAGPRPPRNIHRTPEPPSTIPRPTDGADPRLVGFASIASLVGLPAIMFPVLHNTDIDVPIEMQLIGAPHTEPELIAFAQRVSGLLGGPGFEPVPLSYPADQGGLR